MTSSFGYGVEPTEDEIKERAGRANASVQESILYNNKLEDEQREIDEAMAQQSLTGEQLGEPGQESTAQPQESEAPKQPGDPGTNPNTPSPEAADQFKWNEEVGEYEMKAGDALQLGFAPVVGAIDGFTDLYNWFTPGPDIPKIPQFRGQAAQGLREISSYLAPMFTGIGGLGNLAKGIQSAGGITVLGKTLKTPKIIQALGNNPIFKFFAKHGLEGGVGAAVDVSNRNSEEANLQSTLRELFKNEAGTKTLGLFPEDWATQDTDSPDLKRHKNAMEGFGLGIFTGIAEGLVTIGDAARKTYKATQYIPKDESAEKVFKSFKEAPEKLSDDPIADRVLQAQARQEAAKDELGEYFVAKINSANLDEGLPFQTVDEIVFEKPQKGIHTSFDWMEDAVRTVDPDGVPGAMVDAVRIQKNIGTSYGRLGSMVTEAALKWGLEGKNLQKRHVVLAVKEHIAESGKFDALVNGRTITDKEIDEAGTFLAEVMAEMEPGQMRQLLFDYMKMDDELKMGVVNSVGYDAVFKAFKNYRDMFLNLDEKKAQALLTTSLAGQASDMAGQLPNLEGTAAIDAARDMIFDRMEYLMVEKALASRDAGAVLRNMNVWDRIKRLTNPGKAAKEFVAEQAEDRARFLTDVVADSKRWIGQIRTIGEQKPMYLKPLYELYDASNGKLRTMYHLNRYVRNNLANITKGFIDGEPEIPNLVVQGFWTNYFHSILSATATPVAAFLGNTGGLISRPITSMAGALMSGDLKTFQRMTYQYTGFADAFNNAWSHGWEMWKLSDKHPDVVAKYGRLDLVQKNEANMQVIQSFADAAMREGNDGPAILLEHVKAQHDWAANPMVRFSARAMTTYDAFTKAFVATAEARGNAIDEILSKTKNGKLTKKAKKKIQEAEYKRLFNEEGFVRENSPTDYYGREIALNVDSVMAESINEITKRFPMIKPWFLFPRTSVNMVGSFINYGPTKLFVKDWYDLTTPGRTLDQVPVEHIEKVLKMKGINVDADAFNTFRQMRYEAKGRVAVGTGTIMAAGYAFMNDRIRGDGHYNYNVQQSRRSNGWESRTYKGLDGKWHSYKHLGPIADWLAATANVMDNFDSLTTARQEELFNKLAFIMATTITNRSVLSQVQPLNDIFNGKTSAVNRWASTFINGSMPFAGLRSQFSRIMTEGMKEYDDDIVSGVRNRNNYLDLIDPSGALPDQYNYIDGGKASSLDFWTRASSNILGFPTYDGQSENRQFLIDIEYDSRPIMDKGQKGVELTDDERSYLQNVMGQDGYFAKELTRIRKKAEAGGFEKNVRAARRDGITGDLGDTQIFIEIDKALSVAKGRAMRYLKLYQEQQQRINSVSDREKKERMLEKETRKFGLSYF